MSMLRVITRLSCLGRRHTSVCVNGIRAAGTSSNEDVYQSPAVREPSMDQLSDIAARLGLDMPAHELAQYHGILGGMVGNYNKLGRYPEPKPEVKYPRTPGYRPSPEENTHNAWYYKTDIQGAPSGPLKGKTVAIKDNVAVAGVPLMNGSKLMEGYMPEFDATLVTRILDAGGAIKGKAACEDLCFSGSSMTCSTGTILNPHDVTRSAGGSSAGSAVLVALGEVDMAIGGDQGGSIRIPATWCGVAGHKPTYGLVPYTGAMSICPALDHLGPIAKTVYDCALFLEVIAGCDGLDSRQPSQYDVPQYTKALDGDITGLKIGLITEGFDGSEPDVGALVTEAAQRLTKAGAATVEEVSIPIHNDGEAIWFSVCAEGGYETIVNNFGLTKAAKEFYPTTMNDYFAGALKSRINDLSVPMKVVCLIGQYMREEYNNRFFAIGSNLTRTLTQAYDDALQQYDVIVLPTIKYKAPKFPGHDATIMDVIGHSLSMVANTAPFNNTGHPVLTVNTGFSEGLPVGMSVIGRHFDDATVLRVGHAYEKLLRK